MSFFLDSAAQKAAPPFGDFNPRAGKAAPAQFSAASGSSEFTAQKRRRPEGRLNGSPIPFRDFKISILTVPFKKKDTLKACLSFWVSRAVGQLRPSMIQMLGGGKAAPSPRHVSPTIVNPKN